MDLINDILIFSTLLQDAEKYRDFILEKLERHDETVKDLDILDLLEKQQSFIDPENIDSHDIKDLESVLKPPSPRSQVKKVSRKERVRKLQISYVYNAEGEKVYDYSSLPVDESAYAPTTYVKKSDNPNETIEYR